MARPTLPGKRVKISVLDVVIVIGGIVGIMAFNRVSINKLKLSLPDSNSQIAGEWKATRGPEHLVFRADNTVSMTVAANPAEGNATSAQETNVPAPVTGKYQMAHGGKVVIHLMNGNNYTTTISAGDPEKKIPGNPNRFDLIDSVTGGVTTFERQPAAPASAGTTPQEPSQ